MDTVTQGFFMLRRPMFPLEILYDFNVRVGSHPDLFETELISFFSQPLASQAIFTASPGLYNAFLQVKEGKKTASPKLFLSLYKYLIRMCSRATPYGLFAGIASGAFGEHTAICFAEGENHFKTHTRLDMAILSEIMTNFQKRDHIQDQARFFTNSSLYDSQGYYRYVESIESQNGPDHLLSAVAASPELDQILALSRQGCTIEQMTGTLTDNMSLQQARHLIKAAIEAQLIENELQANVTGPLYQKVVIEKLERMQGTLTESGFLKEVNRLLDDTVITLDKLTTVQKLLSHHFANMEEKAFIQTDINLLTQHCTIGRRCIEILGNEFDNIMFLMGANNLNELDNFKRDFFDRYENREIPLLTALDSESGIGYGDHLPGSSDHLPLLDQISMPSKRPSANFNHLSGFKQQLIEKSLAGKVMSVSLNDQELGRLRKNAVHSPGDFYLMGSLISVSQKELDEGNFKFVLKAAGGVSGFELMGRFCHIDQQLADKVRSAAARIDRQQNVILAEIAHLPQPRTANILQRPHLSRYEIVYLAQSTMPKNNQIQVSDLMISVPDGKQVVIRSKRLNKRIVPCLSTAHNFSEGLPVYRFLCDVCHQNSPSLQGWSWGHLENHVFLPRVEYKHWIITRANWTFEKNIFPLLFSKEGSFTEQWKQACQQLHMPRYLQLCQGDNELLIDNDSGASLMLLKEIFSKEQKVRLTEFLEQPAQGVVTHEGKYFTNEIVIPFHGESAIHLSSFQKPSPGSNKDIKRDFPPGSEWLYVKIYTGTRTADGLLVSLIKPFCEQMLESGQIEKWFFVRYQDPDNHIRLRFYHASKPDFWQAVMDTLHNILKPLIESATVNRQQTDTYKREIERYAGLTPEQTESIFQADSQAVLQLLELTLVPDENDRWLAGLFGVDRLLEDFGLKPEHKRQLAEMVYMNLFSEFEGDSSLSIQLNNQYRQHKDLIFSFMGQHLDNPRPDIAEIFQQRSTKVNSILQGPEPGTARDPQLVASFIHMFLNRLFMSRSRQQELVIYHYLNKYYKSSNKINTKH